MNSLRSSIYADVAKVIREDGISTNGSFLRVYHDLQSHLAESMVFESHTRVCLVGKRPGTTIRRSERLSKRTSIHSVLASSFDEKTKYAADKCTHYIQEIDDCFISEIAFLD